MIPVPIIEGLHLYPSHVVVWVRDFRMVHGTIYRMVDGDPTRLEVAE